MHTAVIAARSRYYFTSTAKTTHQRLIPSHLLEPALLNFLRQRMTPIAWGLCQSPLCYLMLPADSPHWGGYLEPALWGIPRFDAEVPRARKIYSGLAWAAAGCAAGGCLCSSVLRAGASLRSAIRRHCGSFPQLDHTLLSRSAHHPTLLAAAIIQSRRSLHCL